MRCNLRWLQVSEVLRKFACETRRQAARKHRSQVSEHLWCRDDNQPIEMTLIMVPDEVRHEFTGEISLGVFFRAGSGFECMASAAG